MIEGNEKEIAETFNGYFSEIGNAISDEIDKNVPSQSMTVENRLANSFTVYDVNRNRDSICDFGTIQQK